MALRVGYNFVRGAALNDFLQSFSQRFDEPAPTKISVVNFLRQVERRESFPHQCLQVEGFHRLWEVVEEEGELAERLKKVLGGSAADWMMRAPSKFIYFVLPHEVSFIVAQHTNIRLPDGRLIDLTPVFGHLSEQSSDHYHKGFNIDS